MTLWTNNQIWDGLIGELREALEGYTNAIGSLALIYSLAFSQDGKTLASASQDETIRLWPINQ